MDRALAGGDRAAITAAWREAYVAAHASRDWPGMIAVGDAAMRAARATGSAEVFEPRTRASVTRAILRGMTRSELPTPALLLDLDRFERNLQKMAAYVKTVGKKLRPHAKTHKCPEIARRQIAAGAVGVCVAKVGEADVMAAAGVRNILITTEVVGPGEDRSPARRARATARRPWSSSTIRTTCASSARRCRARGRVLNVLVDVDVLRPAHRRAAGRAGAGARAAPWCTSRRCNLRGLQGYAGHCAHVIGWEERRRTSRRCMARLMKTRELFEKNGLPVDDRERRLERHVQHRHRARRAHRAAERLVLRDGPRLPAHRRPGGQRLRRLRDGAHRVDHGGQPCRARRWR